MASVFGHAAAAYAIGQPFPTRFHAAKFWMLGILCAIVPDADVISFEFGIPYESFWGHRGFTHSFVFAFLWGLLIAIVFYGKSYGQKSFWLFVLFFFLCTASHPILDAMTNGGRGVAFFAPFDNSRYFLPWRPIQVSPLGASRFFSEWGLKVILSELIWIGIPSLIIILATRFSRR